MSNETSKMTCRFSISSVLIYGLDNLWRVQYLSTDCGVEATRKIDCCFWQELWDLLIEMNTQHQQSDGVRICDVYGLQVKHDYLNDFYTQTLAIVSGELQGILRVLNV